VPRIQCFTVSRTNPDTGHLRGFGINDPQPGAVLCAADMTVCGWVEGRSVPVVAVEVVRNGVMQRRSAVHSKDSARSSEAPQRAGGRAMFHLPLPMLVPKRTEFELQAVLADQHRVLMARLVVGPALGSDASGQAPLVSVVIPCYNQAHYLGEAIESVLRQTYPHLEVVVVDDGSRDNTAEVAARYPGVRCIRQANRGLAEARNTGIRGSNGSYLVFLDADDRLLPLALEAGMNCFSRSVDAGLVWGRFRFIAADGRVLVDNLGFAIKRDHYISMLRSNFIPMPGSVMYRRSVLETVRGFNTSAKVKGCEDYDLYLRITRQFPVACHDAVVADYRQYGSSMSRNAGLMLQSSLSVLRSQWPYVRKSQRCREAYQAGAEFWSDLFGEPLVHQVREHIHEREWRNALRNALPLMRHCPRGLLRLIADAR
jgi:glycosyl transferase family 2